MYSGNKTGIDANMSVTVKANVKNVVRVKSTGSSGLGGKESKSSNTTISGVNDGYSHQVTAELDKLLSNKGE